MPPFTFPFKSRDIITAIYRWYKILSPVIHIHIDSVAFDEEHLKLYVTARQEFRFWFLPWRVPAELVTVVGLEKRRVRPPAPGDSSDEEEEHTDEDEDEEGKKVNGVDPERYYIISQKDLYQFEQWVGFFPLIGLGLRWMVLVTKWTASIVCLLGVMAITWFGRMIGGSYGWGVKEKDRAMERVLGVERRFMDKIRDG